ncbi:MAG TPA: FAD-dependent monooxygenase, partial [Desulfomonilia bacterium]|nr:FAD-dependent monooxygenase [Desulfomonilia bacterium]
MSSTEYTHAIVIGAGPAGLGASLGLAAKGHSVRVLDQQEELGKVRRGETIRADAAMEAILGRGFFDRITRKKINRRRYYSHTGNCFVDRSITNPNIIFEWPLLIGEMAGKAERSGVRIHTGHRVIGLLEHSGTVNGAVTVNDGVEHVFVADTVISCGGCNDPCSQHLSQTRSGVDMAVVKRLAKGYEGPDDRLEYFFHIDDSGLVIAAMFPRGGTEAEFILMSTSAGECRLPVFDEFSRIHERYGKLLEGTQT